MATSFSLGLLLVATMIISPGAVHVYKVGDIQGWRMPEDNNPALYETWASKIKFLPGDSIVFEYRNDSVVEVSKRGYFHCNETNHHDSVPKDGSTVFLLEKTGFYYFVSGDVEHCKKGEKMAVEVVGQTSLPVVVGGPAPSPHSSTGILAVGSRLMAAAVMGITCVYFSGVFT